MTYSTLQLEQIEKMAALYMTITDIATILNVSSEQLRWDISQKDTDVSKAYHKGKASRRKIQRYALLFEGAEPDRWRLSLCHRRRHLDH